MTMRLWTQWAFVRTPRTPLPSSLTRPCNLGQKITQRSQSFRSVLGVNTGIRHGPYRTALGETWWEEGLGRFSDPELHLMQARLSYTNILDQFLPRKKMGQNQIFYKGSDPLHYQLNECTKVHVWMFLRDCLHLVIIFEQDIPNTKIISSFQDWRNLIRFLIVFVSIYLKL